MKLSNKTYDILKFIALTVLPATITLVYAIFEIWDLDMSIAAGVGGTLGALGAFIGVTIGISTAQYTAEKK